jgi:prophage regulatory protein
MYHLKSDIKFDDLPDLALIQIKPLINYRVLPYSATTVWRKCKEGKFPKPIKVSTGITAWRVGDIRKYLLEISTLKVNRVERGSKSC